MFAVFKEQQEGQGVWSRINGNANNRLRQDLKGQCENFGFQSE